MKPPKKKQVFSTEYVLGLRAENAKLKEESQDDPLFRAVTLERDRLREALQFYADRAVYERSNQFPGDSEMIDVSHIARDALKVTAGEETKE